MICQCGVVKFDPMHQCIREPVLRYYFWNIPPSPHSGDRKIEMELPQRCCDVTKRQSDCPELYGMTSQGISPKIPDHLFHGHFVSGNGGLETRLGVPLVPQKQARGTGNAMLLEG